LGSDHQLYGSSQQIRDEGPRMSIHIICVIDLRLHTYSYILPRSDRRLVPLRHIDYIHQLYNAAHRSRTEIKGHACIFIILYSYILPGSDHRLSFSAHQRAGPRRGNVHEHSYTTLFPLLFKTNKNKVPSSLIVYSVY
jgi:hypothetical protein